LGRSTGFAVLLATAVLESVAWCGAAAAEGRVNVMAEK
jgi:hypothetical protein